MLRSKTSSLEDGGNMRYIPNKFEFQVVFWEKLSLYPRFSQCYSSMDF
jgi:hypothetical protein